VDATMNEGLSELSHANTSSSINPDFSNYEDYNEILSAILKLNLVKNL
jgi:hypothetical protein